MSRVVALACATLLAGCGGASSAERSEPASAYSPSECQAAGRDAGVRYRLCFKPNRTDHGTLEAFRDGSWRSLPTGHPPDPPGQTPLVGHWAWAALSPDGETFVATWSAECEVPQAYLLPSTGDPPRMLADGRTSVALGWAPDGRAIIRVFGGDCGSVRHSRLYLVARDGSLDRWRPSKPIRRSLAPVSAVDGLP